MNKKAHKLVGKPWGGYLILEKSPHFWLKKLFINRGQQLSLQSHCGREEVWLVLRGKIKAQKGRSFFVLRPGDCLKIARGEKHRISALAKAAVLEAAFGEPRERDVVRYEDRYGRAG